MTYIIKNHVFPMMKFLEGPLALAFSMEPKTICRAYFARSSRACVDNPSNRDHWQKVARVVPAILNAKRTGVTKMIKRYYISKCD